MRNFFILICFIGFIAKAKADDVTANVIPTVIGLGNGAITLTISAGIAPYTFNWTGPDGFVSTDQDISSLASGEYCVTVMDAFCGEAMLCAMVEETAANAITAINNSTIAIQVSPNPFTSEIAISVNTIIAGDYTIELQDISGKLILANQAIFKQGENNVTIQNIPQLAGGPYQVVVILPNGSNYSRTVIHL